MKKKEKSLRSVLAAALSLCIMLSPAASSAFTAYADETSEQTEIDPAITELIPESDPTLTETTDKNADIPYEEPDGDGSAGQFNEDNRVVKMPAASIKFTVPDVNRITIGSTFQLEYQLNPLHSDDIVTFRSNNRSVVTVDDNGLVTAVGYGKTKVSVKTGSGKSKTVIFIVTNADGSTNSVKGTVEAIGFADQTASIRVDSEISIEPIIYPFGVSSTLSYRSENTNVASVSSKGIVTAVGTGTTNIIVTAENGVSGIFSVTVYDDVFKGIDVSKWQGEIDWQKVCSQKIDYVMIRSSYGSENTDIFLSQNVEGCEKYGMDYGFYHYTYARNAAEAKNEAHFFLNNIRNYSPTYPIVLDIEEEFYKKMSRKEVTDIIVAFMEELENAGYYATLYSYAKFFADNVDMQRVKEYDIWIASWGDEEKLNDNYDGHYGMWQYSSTGHIDGIEGEVDLNYAYKNYAQRIKKNGLNGL